MEWIESLRPDGSEWTRLDLQDRHATKPEVIGAAVRRIGHGPVCWAVETSGRILNRLREAGEGNIPRGSTGHEREGCETGLLTALISLQQGSFTPDLVQTPAVLDIARVAFRQGLPLDSLTHKIWASHTASQDELITAMEKLVPPAEHLKVIQRMNQIMFAYGNGFVSALTGVYEKERRAWHGRAPEDQRRLILAVANGAKPPVDPEIELGGRIDGGHLQAIVWSGVDGYVAERDAHVDAWAFSVADQLGARRMVSFQQEDAAQLWWTFPGETQMTAIEIIRKLPRPEWMRIAVGPPGMGLEGFRDSYHGAAIAAGVGRASAQGTFWNYDDVALLGLAIADRSQAARFTRSVLGELLQPGERLADLRETVRLYLAEGNSRIAVAKALHVAPTTVAYRVAQAGQIIGEAISSRPLEVQLALELAHQFPGLVGIDKTGETQG